MGSFNDININFTISWKKEKFTFWGKFWKEKNKDKFPTRGSLTHRQQFGSSNLEDGKQEEV